MNLKAIFRNKVLWIASLGYFVDLYDLVLYGVVRVPSLRSLGLSDAEIFTIGSKLLNIQMAGMLIGGFAWGILGDKRGRRAALFGSIFLYSIATFLNAFVTNVEQYAVLRFLAGVGLAGELGAAITLVTETLPLGLRGFGSAMVASIGFMGAVASSSIAQHLSWQQAYLSGGTLGILLLFARMNLTESTIYLETKSASVASATQWGSIRLLFATQHRAFKVLWCLLMGVPIWYVAGILSYFAPEFAKEFHIQGEVTAGTTIMLGYMGSIIGDVICGLLSQKLQSRKKAVLYFMIFGAVVSVGHNYFMEGATAGLFYFGRAVIGFSNGYIAVLVAWIAELFGTNLRATATTLIPNLIRAAVIPLTASIAYLRPNFGLVQSSIILGVICFGAALLAVTRLDETFHREMKFEER